MCWTPFGRYLDCWSFHPNAIDFSTNSKIRCPQTQLVFELFAQQDGLSDQRRFAVSSTITKFFRHFGKKLELKPKTLNTALASSVSRRKWTVSTSSLVCVSENGYCVTPTILVGHCNHLSSALLTVRDWQQLPSLRCRRRELMIRFSFSGKARVSCAHNCSYHELPRRRQAPSRFQIGFGEGYHPTTPEDWYRGQYFLALDVVMACIRERFNQPGYQTYQRLESLLTAAAAGADYEADLDFVCKFYGSDLDRSQLQTHLKLLHSLVKVDQASQRFSHPFSHWNCLVSAEFICRRTIVHVTGVQAGEADTRYASDECGEWTQRICTAEDKDLRAYLRKTMTQERLNSLLVLHVHKDKTDKLNLNSCLNDFASSSTHKRFVFGKF